MPPSNAARRTLVVVVPGISGGFKGWKPLLDRLKSEPELSDSEWLMCDHGKRWYSFGDPAAVALHLRARIDQEWLKSGPFESVILIGHSFGGVIVRQAFLDACDANQAAHASFEWATAVSRIVLFASLNRGYNASRTRTSRTALWFARVLPVLHRLIVWDLVTGADFITNLRITWIRHFAALGSAAPVVVQMLGTDDSVVARDDSIDVEQSSRGYLIDVPEASHRDLFELDTASDPEGRYALVRDGVINEVPLLASNRAISGPAHVVFVLHGIRADNHTWVKDIVDDINGRLGPQVHAIGPYYTRITAIQFAIPMTRRRHLRWFQDAYTDALARNPAATFGFIGHSNGTYVFGESLRAIPAMRFDRATLVGAVLPTDYDWDARIAAGQITSLRVDGSCYDWPVGWLCSALRGLGMTDVGTGGFDGFTKVTAGVSTDFLWYAGGHSAPLRADNLPALSAYAIDGTIVAPEVLGKQIGWFAFISRILYRLAPITVVAGTVAYVRLAFTNLNAALSVAAALLVVIFLLDVF